MLLSSLSLNLFCRFLTCFSHPSPPSTPHPLGISNTLAYTCTDAQHTHSGAQTWRDSRHTCSPADSPGRKTDFRRCDIWRVLQHSQTPGYTWHPSLLRVKARVCFGVCECACVHASCPLRCVGGDAGGGWGATEGYMSWGYLISFSWMDHRGSGARGDVGCRYWPTWCTIVVQWMQRTCMCMCKFKIHVIHPGERSRMWSCKSAINVYEVMRWDVSFSYIFN